MLVSFISYCQVVGSKLCVPDTDDVKQKTSLKNLKNLLGIVSWFLFFCFMSSVSGAQSKCQLYTDRFLLLDHTFLYGAVYLAVQGGFTVKPGHAYPPKFH